jgi:uncharacterized glyoxalase superfamily protein PhnB
MANISITSTANSITIDFGIYSGLETSAGLLPLRRTIPKNRIFNASLTSNNVEVIISDNLLKMPLVYTPTAGNLTVDFINAVAPNSNNDLYDKLIALIA